MKLLIITGIFPPDIGGPATYVPAIASALVERGHDVCVLTLSDRLNHDDGGYSFRVFRIARNLFKPLRWAKTVARVCSLGRSADALLACGLCLETVLGNLLIRKPLVMRVVGDLAWERASLRNLTSDGFEPFQVRRQTPSIELVRLLQKCWVRAADRVFVPSQYLADCVGQWGIRKERLVVIPNFVELPEDLQAEVADFEGPVKAITVGRLVPHKRVDGIIEAVAHAKNLGLLVVGDGPERANLERLVTNLGLGHRVLFAGTRSHDDTVRLMKSCDFFVLNSTYEGLPHVLIEAMGVGLPVVATPSGGTVEIVRNHSNGLLADSHDALCSAVRTLAACPELRARLAENGRAFVRGRFGKSEAVETLERTLFQAGAPLDTGATSINDRTPLTGC